MRRLLSLLHRRQEGVALPVAIGALSVTMALAAGTFLVVVQGTKFSQRDRDSKRALAAAEAGLQMAALKVTELKPSSGQCVTTAIAAPVNGECPATSTQTLGNGASYTYVVSLPSVTAQCATLPFAGFAASASDRCITATGTVNGVKRRLQMRYAYDPPFQPWKDAGLVGKDKVQIDNNKTINSPIGTNGAVIVGNNTGIIGTLLLPDGNPTGDPNATVTLDQNATITGGRVDHDAWTFPTLDWSVVPRQQNNNNLLAGMSGWNPGTKILTPGDGQVITLPSDTDGVTDFWMCGIDAESSNEFWINVPNGKTTRIWIDGDRTGGGCSNGPGTFDIKNNGHINTTDDKNPAELEFYVWGSKTDSVDTPDINFKNGVEFYATIWAPNSSINIWNNQTISGAFTAKNIDLKNNGGFSYDARIANKTLPGSGSVKNVSWTECRRDPTTTTDPESGCS